MAETKALPVRKLVLDMQNFRTMPQPDESAAVHALIAIDTDWFWTLMESLIDTGYLPTENIILLKEGKKLVVKEGNRRIAALKILHGYLDAAEFDLPDNIQEKLVLINSQWKRQNKDVPCTLYESTEAALVDRIVSLTHGKGDKAGRAKWKAIARARHNRAMAKASEPGLDLLESFLSRTKRLSEDQKERWSGDFHVTILDEAIKRLAGRMGFKSASDLAKSYPKIKDKAAIDEIILDIGHKQLDFKRIRASPDFGVKYGLPPIVDASSDKPNSPGDGQKGGNDGNHASGSGAQPGDDSDSTDKSDKGAKARAPKAHSADDPKAVAAALKKFQPRGADREKLVSLLKEIRKIDLEGTPHAFCFLLRSMFEVSAKAYCVEKNIRTKDNNGKDRTLLDLLKAVSAAVTNNHQDVEKERLLHGAMQELNNPIGILSVVSMNQLIHSPQVLAKPESIAIVFHHVLPLLEEMSR